MNMLHRMLFTLLVFWVLQLQLQAQESGDKPNVLFIMVDDLNDYVAGMESHPQVRTPHIEHFAQTGVSFVNAHSNNPVSAPSRSSFMTGVYPHTSKKFFFSKWYDNPVLQNCKTMPEYFNENGYLVAGTGKLFHHNRKGLWDEWGYNKNVGPFPFNGEERVGHPSVPEPFRSIGPVDGSFGPLSDVPSFPDNTDTSQHTGWVYDWSNTPFHYESPTNRDPMPDEQHAQWAVDKLEEYSDASNSQPFFLAVGFSRPHTPMHVPKKYFDMFPLDELKLPVIRENDKYDTHYLDAFPDSRKGPRYYRTLKASYPSIEEGLKEFVQAYLACVSFVDDQIGQVLDALDNSGLRENTIVVLTSDHGWNLGEKEYLFKGSPWEESTRVPFIVRAPGLSQPGTEVHHPVSLIDIYPTFVDLCGLTGSTVKNEQGAPLDGHSLKPFLGDPGYDQWSGPNGALTAIYAGITKDDIYQQTYSYRTSEWRYILYQTGDEELYHHSQDAYEWQNLADDEAHQDVKQRLKAELMNLLSGKPTGDGSKLPEEQGEQACRVYPNPASSVLHVKLKVPMPGTCNLRITDLSSRSVMTDQIYLGRHDADFRIHLDRGLKAGMYILSLQTGNRQITRRFVLDRNTG